MMEFEFRNTSIVLIHRWHRCETETQFETKKKDFAFGKILDDSCWKFISF